MKIVATRCQILTLKCTKIDFDWSSAPQTPLGELTQRSPDPLAGFKGPTSKGRGEEGRREGGMGGGARPVCLLVLTTDQSHSLPLTDDHRRRLELPYVVQRSEIIPFHGQLDTSVIH